MSNANKRRTAIGCFAKIALATLFVFAVGGWWLYRKLTWVPDFYAAAIAAEEEVARVDPVTVQAQRQESADAAERQVLEARNQVQRAESWRLELTADEINAWITESLGKKVKSALPKEIDRPRAAIVNNEIHAAFRIEALGGGVVSVIVSPGLAETPNTVAIRLRSIRVGDIPLPQQRLKEMLSKGASDAQIMLAWTEIEGELTALITIPERNPGWKNRVLKLDFCGVVDDKIVIQGTSEEAQANKKKAPDR